MSDTFNWSRFRGFAVKHYAEHWKFYLLDLLGSVCVLLLFYFMDYQNQRLGAINVLIAVGLFVNVTLWIRRNMTFYATRTTAVTSLTLPVSSLEKYLFAWLNSFLGSSGVWLLAYCLVNSLFEIIFGTAATFFTFMISQGMHMISVFILVHMVFWCEAAFGRRGRIALVGAFLSVILFYGLLRGIVYLLIGGATFWGLLLGQTLEIQAHMTQPCQLIYLIGWQPFTYFMAYIFIGLTWSVLMVSGYFKFKERQIK